MPPLHEVPIEEMEDRVREIVREEIHRYGALLEQNAMIGASSFSVVGSIMRANVAFDRGDDHVPLDAT